MLCSLTSTDSVNVNETHHGGPPLLLVLTDRLCDSWTALKLTPHDFVVLPGESDKSSKWHNPRVERHFGLAKDAKGKSLHSPLCRFVPHESFDEGGGSTGAAAVIRPG